MVHVHIHRINVYLSHPVNQPVMIRLHAIHFSLASIKLVVCVQIRLVKTYMQMVNVIHY